MKLKIENLKKSYNGKAVLTDYCLTAGPGITRIEGPSGWGKTTLLRLVLGLEQPDSGKISFYAQPASVATSEAQPASAATSEPQPASAATPDGIELSREAVKFAAVFQEDRLLEHLSAERNLEFALGEAFDKAEAAEILEHLGLPEVAAELASDGAPTAPTASDGGNQPAAKVSTYSGGMKRRLALARALLMEADVLILDEPFTGLDEDNKKRALEVINSKAHDKIVLLVSHE